MKCGNKILRLLLLLCTAALLLTGCQAPGPDSTDGFYMYFQEADRKQLKPVSASVDWTMENQMFISSIWNNLKNPSQGAGYLSTVPKDLELNSFSMENHNLILNFSAEYYNMDSVQELLCRAAIVKTFVQLQEVNTVEIRVEKQPLTLSDGTVLGPQKGAGYTDVLAVGLNDYAEADVVLYFADATGKKLRTERRRFNYQTGKPLEQYVIQLLLNGPKEEGNYPVFPASTKLLSVSTNKGVCHVNLNSAVLDEELSVSPEVLIYSLCNSLTELPDITQVQIAINGTSTVLYKNEISLDTPLTHNLDLLDQE